MQDKVLEGGERVANIINLVEACRRCQAAFRTPVLRHLTENDHVREVLEQFAFELLTEARRMNDGEPGARLSDLNSAGPASVPERDEHAALQTLAQAYETVLAHHMPGRASAMIKRQAQLIEQLVARFNALYATSV